MTIREFTRNIYAYIKTVGEYVVTIDGSKKLVVTIRAYDANVEKINDNLKKGILPKREIDGIPERDVVTKKDTFKELKKQFSVDTYSCGCKKGDFKLCPKHRRS